MKIELTDAECALIYRECREEPGLWGCERCQQDAIGEVVAARIGAALGPLADLFALADAATPGPWVIDDAIDLVRSVDSALDSVCDVIESRQEDRDYIAAVSPSVIKSLIERVRAAEAQTDRLTKAMWLGWAALGFDTDGDDGPGAMIAGAASIDGWVESWLRDVRQHVLDSDEGDAELEADNERLRTERDQWQDKGMKAQSARKDFETEFLTADQLATDLHAEVERLRTGIAGLVANPSIRRWIDNSELVDADDLRALLLNPAQADQSNGQSNTCGHQSASGVDQTFGPDKIWRCDHCGLRWQEDQPYNPADKGDK